MRLVDFCFIFFSIIRKINKLFKNHRKSAKVVVWWTWWLSSYNSAPLHLGGPVSCSPRPGSSLTRCSLAQWPEQLLSASGLEFGGCRRGYTEALHAGGPLRTRKEASPRSQPAQEGVGGEGERAEK